MNNIYGTSIYIHFPFCRRRCIYCDFNTYGGINLSERLRYHKALLMDIERSAVLAGGMPSASADGFNYGINCVWSSGPFAFAEGMIPASCNSCGRIPVSTVYFGGGTPTFAPSEWLIEALQKIKDCFFLLDGAEITFEANPGTLTPEYLKELHAGGFNRMSMGVQALNEFILDKLGRIHSASEAEESFRMAKKFGFDNINLDLIYGLPYQTPEIWHNDLQKIIDLEPQHISCYALSVEDNTPLKRMLDNGSLELPSEDDCYEMEDILDRTASDAGFEHYEISNWAKPGRYCRHNLVYWNNSSYLGCGAGAVSYWNGWRINRCRNPREYCSRIESGFDVSEGFERLGITGTFCESLMTGLRTSCGIYIPALLSRYPEKWHAELICALKSFAEEISADLLKIEEDRIFFTNRGRDLSNEVFIKLLDNAAFIQAEINLGCRFE